MVGFHSPGKPSILAKGHLCDEPSLVVSFKEIGSFPTPPLPFPENHQDDVSPCTDWATFHFGVTQFLIPTKCWHYPVDDRQLVQDEVPQQVGAGLHQSHLGMLPCAQRVPEDPWCGVLLPAGLYCASLLLSLGLRLFAGPKSMGVVGNSRIASCRFFPATRDLFLRWDAWKKLVV